MTTQAKPPTQIDLWLMDWVKQDYSWNGLQSKQSPQPGLSLTDFWRRAPNGHLRTDQQLMNAGYLVDCGEHGVFHAAYLPKTWYDKLPNDQACTREYAELNELVWNEQAPFIQAGIPIVLTGAFLSSQAANWFGSIGSLSFDECAFLDDFHVSRVDGIRTFKNTLFLGKVIAKNVGMSDRHSNKLVFETCELFGEVQFEEGQYDFDLKIDNCNLHERFKILEGNFRRDVRFEVSRFRSRFSISQASFSGHFSLFECDFSSDFNIYDSMFHSEVSFNEVSLLGDIEIVACRFNDRARFADIQWPEMGANTAWGHETLFSSDVAFSDLVPPPIQLFDDMRFGGTVAFPRTSDKAWREAFEVELSAISNAWREHFTEMRQLESGCRTLRKAAAANGNVHLEHQWHRCELVARRNGADVSIVERGLSFVYGICADYGLSISRPFLILAALSCLFATVYALIYSGIRVSGKMDWQSLTEGFGYSFNRTLPIGVFEFSDDVWRNELLGSAGTWKSIAVRAIASLQTIMSVVLIYLGVMAARRKFKIS